MTRVYLFQGKFSKFHFGTTTILNKRLRIHFFCGWFLRCSRARFSIHLVGGTHVAASCKWMTNEKNSQESWGNSVNELVLGLVDEGGVAEVM